MTCRHCHREHGAGVLCQGVSRRAFFFFGASAGLAAARAVRDPLVDDLDQQISDFVQGEVGPGFKVFFSQGMHAGEMIEVVEQVDLSKYITSIDLDEIHRQLAGLRKLEPFEVTLSGFWEDARTGKG